MSNTIKQIRYRMVLFEYATLVLTVGLILFFLITNFVKREYHKQQLRIEEISRSYADFLAEFDYLPRNISQNTHSVFVIDKSRDEFVIDRFSQGTYDDLLWEQYSAKLIYQMQKQRQGWAVYPVKKPWQIFSYNKSIRFRSMEGKNWILAVEFTRPSEWRVIRQVMTNTTIWQVFLVLLAGYFLVKYRTMLNMNQIKDHFTKHLSKNELQFKADTMKLKPKISSPTLNDKDSTEEISAYNDSIYSSMLKKDPSTKKTNKPLSATPVSSGSSPEEDSKELESVQSPVLKKLLKEFRKG